MITDIKREQIDYHVKEEKSGERVWLAYLRYFYNKLLYVFGFIYNITLFVAVFLFLRQIVGLVRANSSSDSDLYKFVENKIEKKSENWIEECSHSEEVRSKISSYFGSEEWNNKDRFCKFLKIPRWKFKEKFFGDDSEKNFIFYGEPGTGKSYCALSIAKNISSHYCIVAGGSLQRMYVGSGSAKWEAIIKNARKIAMEKTTMDEENPVVIIVEEIDSLAILKERNDSSDTTLVNTFLESVDSIKRDNLKIIIIGTTNVIDKMEPAAVRSGRFSQLHFGYPDEQGLDSILEIVKTQIINNCKVQLINKQSGDGWSDIHRELFSEENKNERELIVIYSDYWKTLKEKIKRETRFCKSLSYNGKHVYKESYAVTFPQINSSVKKSLCEAKSKFVSGCDYLIADKGLAEKITLQRDSSQEKNQKISNFFTR